MPTTIEKPKTRKPSARVIPLGNEIDAIWQLRETKREADAVVKGIEAQIKLAETALLARMDKEGMPKGSGKFATVSVGESINGTIEKWDDFTAYLAKSGNFQLIQHRVSDLAYREMLGMGHSIPGVKPFTKRSVNIRTIPASV